MDFGIGNVILIIGILIGIIGMIFIIIWVSTEFDSPNYDKHNHLGVPGVAMIGLGFILAIVGGVNLGSKTTRTIRKYYELKQSETDAQNELQKYLTLHPELNILEETEYIRVEVEHD